MASHVLLLFFNAILLMVITCGIALYILKKEYAPFLESEEKEQSGKSQ